jgi:predicted DNA-binding WGR domain protein
LQQLSRKKFKRLRNFVMASDDSPDLSSAIASVHLICVNSRDNHNKFWEGYVLPDGALYAKYGRVNYRGQTHSYSCGSVAKAQTKLQQLVREKRSKGYAEVELDHASNQTLNFSVLGERAEKIKAQIHQLEIDAEIIHQYTSIQFDSEKGQYRTNLGILTVQTIERAERLLDQVVYAQGSRNRTTLIQAIEAYLRLIPMPIGMSLNPETLLGEYTQVENQRAAIQALREGIERINQIRDQIKVMIAANQNTNQNERSFWLSWGESDSVEVETAFEDSRSDCVSWS